MPHRPTSHSSGKTARPPGRPAGRTFGDGVIADRESLLAAAERLIRAAGPAVAMDAIAAEADVSKPILYRQVGDRNALVNALAVRLVERMTGQVERLVARAQTPHDALRRLVRGYLKRAAADRNLYVYVTVNGSGADPVRQSLLLADATAERLAAGIAAQRSAQGADPSVAHTWAYALIGALHHVTLAWLRDGATHVERVADQLTALLWSGVGPEGPAEEAPTAGKGAGGRPA